MVDAKIASELGRVLGRDGYAASFHKGGLQWERGSSRVRLRELRGELVATVQEGGKTIIPSFVLARVGDVADLRAYWSALLREGGGKAQAVKYARRLAELMREHKIPSAKAWQTGSSPARVYVGRTAGYITVAPDGTTDATQLSLYPSQVRKYAHAYLAYLSELGAMHEGETGFWGAYGRFVEAADTASAAELARYRDQFAEARDTGMEFNHPVLEAAAQHAFQEAQRLYLSRADGREPNPSWVLPVAQLIVSASGIHRGLVGLKQSGKTPVDDVTLEAARGEPLGGLE